MIIWEYIIDENNNIISAQQWNEKEKPELKDNPVPNQDIINGNLIDKFGNYLYKLENEEIKENIIILNDEQIKIDKLSKKGLLDIVRILIQGIDDPNDNEYLSLKSEILE